MKSKKITPNILLIISLIIVYASCNAQTSFKDDSPTTQSEVSIGDTVEKLSDSLWYIFQDKKKHVLVRK